jgi:hypothetical protein
MNRSRLPLQVFVFAALVVGFSLTAQAQSPPPLATFSSTSNDGTSVMVSKRGNVMTFLSPWTRPLLPGDPPDIGYDHIGGDSEGYVLCYNDPSSENSVRAYDLGDSGEAGFEPPTATCSSGPLPRSDFCTVTRNTSDGVLQLQQVFYFDESLDVPHKRLRIWMKLINRKDVPVSVDELRRQVDLNIDSGGVRRWANAVNNHATPGRDGVIAWNDASGPFGPPEGKDAHGMLLRSIIRPSGEDTVTAKVTQDPRETTCNPPNGADSGHVLGDAGATLQYKIGTIPAGGFRIVQMEYARF